MCNCAVEMRGFIVVENTPRYSRYRYWQMVFSSLPVTFCIIWTLKNDCYVHPSRICKTTISHFLRFVIFAICKVTTSLNIAVQRYRGIWNHGTIVLVHRERCRKIKRGRNSLTKQHSKHNNRLNVFWDRTSLIGSTIETFSRTLTDADILNRHRCTADWWYVVTRKVSALRVYIILL